MKKIYLDHGATTPVLPEVFEEMKPYFLEKFGNASSLHLFGEEAKDALESSREKIAKLIKADIDEIYFTSGGTEADNTGIIGAAIANSHRGKHVITSPIEHEAVLESVEHLRKNGFDVDFLKVNSEGRVDIDHLKKIIRKDTILISIMWVNNETGVIQPIEEISKIARERNIIFHSDAVQALGKLRIDANLVDILSASAHKFYGPKGVGFMYLKKGVKVHPIIFGGGHERGMRSGTENVSGIVGMAKALELCYENFDEKHEKFKNWKDKILKIFEKIGGYHINGGTKDVLATHVNVSFKGVNGEALMYALSLNGIAVSTASACSSHHKNGDGTVSHVLKAMNLDPETINGAIRIVTGLDNTDDDIERFSKVLEEQVNRLRELG